MGIQNKFAQDDPYALTQQILTADNNSAAFNAALIDNDHLRATSASFNNQSLTRTVANPVPDVTVTGADTIGSALADIGQSIAVIGETGGSGDDPGNCFLGNTEFTLWHPDASMHPRRVPFATLYDNQEDWNIIGALSFNEQEERVKGKIESVTRQQVFAYWHVTFDDGTADDVVPEHRYFTLNKAYIPIRDLLNQYVGYEDYRYLKVVSFDEIEVPNGIWVYNAHIKDVQNYCANRRRVHNIKPQATQIAEQ